MQADGARRLEVLQILQIGGKSVYTQAVGSSVRNKEDGLFMVSVQPMEIFRADGGMAEVKVDALPDEMDVYAMDDPTRVDLLQLAGFIELSATKQLRSWQASDSPHDGCVRLTTPVALKPRCSLTDDNVPTLSLMLALFAQCWRGIRQEVSHTMDGEKKWDSRNAITSRYYLQVLLNRDVYFDCGNIEIRSGQPQFYYRALLKLKCVVEAGKGSEHYKGLLRDAGFATTSYGGPRLGRVAAAARRRAQRIAAPTLLAGAFPYVAGDSEYEGGLALAPALPVEPGAPPAVAEDEAEPLAADAFAVAVEPVVPADGAVVMAAAAPAPYAIPEEIHGVRVRFVEGNDRGRGGYAARVQIRCPHHGGRCGKSRSLVMGLPRWGPRAAEFFLGAWVAEGAALDEAAHRAFVPSEDQIQAFRDALLG